MATKEGSGANSNASLRQKQRDTHLDRNVIEMR